MKATYVVIKKAHGPNGIYRKVQTSPTTFESAQKACNGMEMTDDVIEFYVEPVGIYQYR